MWTYTKALMWTIAYCLTPADPVWMRPNCDRPVSVCKGTCRRRQR